MDTRSDDELVMAMPGDPAAFAEFYRRHAGRVLGFALRRSSSPAEVADLVSAVFVQVIESAPRFHPAKGAAVSWLFGVAANVVAGERRRRIQAAGLDERISGQRLLAPDDYERLEERLDAESQSRRIFQAMDRLPPAQRILLSLVALDGLSTPEAAAALGIRPVTARMRLSRARHRMRELLDAPTSAPHPPSLYVSVLPEVQR